MESLEERCLEKLNKILSKFDLKINIIHVTSLSVLQYRLDDNSLSKNTYSDWLGLWLSISDILMHRNSIFECLETYHTFIAKHKDSSYERYSEAYNAIKQLENISCLEEFIFKCDLMGI